MSGKVVRILPRSLFDFSTVVANSSSAEIAVATDVDVSGSRETTLLVRTHALTITGGSGTTATFNVVVRGSAPSAEDPGQYFRDATALVVATPLGATAPVLLRIVIPANAGAWITIFVKAIQYTTTAGTIQATISMDLSLKD